MKKKEEHSQQQPKKGKKKKKELSNSVVCKIVYVSVYPDTGAPLHEERLFAVREEPKLAILRFTHEMALMKYGHSENFVLVWC